MPEENKEGKALTTKNLAFPEELTKLLDRLNYEAKARAEVEKKSLEIADKENERAFQLESDRLKAQVEYYGQKQSQDFKKSLILAGFGLLFLGALLYFSYKKEMAVIKDVFLPLLMAIIGALGGYGYGIHTVKKQQDVV